MYKISSSVQFYNASDKSGVLVFVPKLGKVISLDFMLGRFLSDFGVQNYVSKELLCESLVDLETNTIEQVWTHLISVRIVVRQDNCS